jgi:hypothetical protein
MSVIGYALVCLIWLLVFFLISNVAELGAGIDPVMALTPFPLVFWMRQDMNPQPFNRE